jgi:hypothetical protein
MFLKVKAKVDNLSVADRTLMKGETADCPVDRAKYLFQRGLVEMVDGNDAKPVPASALKRDQTEQATQRSRSSAEVQTRKG